MANDFSLSVDIDDAVNNGYDDTVRLISTSGLSVSSVSRVGFFHGNREVEAHGPVFELASAIGAKSVIVVCGGIDGDCQPNSDASRYSIFRGLDELVPIAQDYGLQLYLEPFHPMFASHKSTLVSLSEAMQVAYEYGHEIGVVIDTFHVWHENSLQEKIANTVKAGPCIVQIADWPKVPTYISYDREFVGEGVIDFPSIFQTLRDVNYSGFIEFEVMSRRLSSLNAGAYLAKCSKVFNALTLCDLS